jgi:hypothetical protein
MLANPFLNIGAGLFCATTNTVDSLCQKIAAGLATAISGDRGRVLDPKWWSEAANQIPHMTALSKSSAVIGAGDMGALAEFCFAWSQSGTLRDKNVSALNDWLNQFVQVNKFNSLIIVEGEEQMLGKSRRTIYVFAVHADGSNADVNVYKTVAAINMSDRRVSSDIKAIFDSITPLEKEQYFIGVDKIAGLSQ